MGALRLTEQQAGQLLRPSEPRKTKPVRLHQKQQNAAEKDIQAAILTYLQRCSKVAWAKRMNTGATKFTGRDGKTRFVRFGFEGCSDILGQLTDGRLLAIEVKTRTGRATDAQLGFLQAVNVANGVGFIARSLDDVVNELREV